MIFLLVLIAGCTQQPTGQAIVSQQPNCREVQEPYDVTETYTETVPYTDSECTSRLYDGKGGYISDDGTWKGDLAISYSLWMQSCTRVNDPTSCSEVPATGTVHKYYITNYESKTGIFELQVNFWDDKNNYIESFSYYNHTVGPGETVYGWLSYDVIWRNKPGKATYFNAQINQPIWKECRDVTKYKDVQRTRTITQYRTVTKCD